MKEFIMQYSQEVIKELTVQQIVLNMVTALAWELVIYLYYRFSHSGAVYSARFNVSLLVDDTCYNHDYECHWQQYCLISWHGGCAFDCEVSYCHQRCARYSIYFLGHRSRYLLSHILLCAGSNSYRRIFLVMLVMGSVKTNNRYLLIIHADCEEAAETGSKKQFSWSGDAARCKPRQGTT